MDLVGTCPKWFWDEWLAEGDCAGDPPSGERYIWETRSPLAKLIVPGDRFYVVSHGKLRGYSVVLHVEAFREFGKGPVIWYGIVRGGNAVPVTIGEPIPGFRGLRKRWWSYGDEVLFPEWWKP